MTQQAINKLTIANTEYRARSVPEAINSYREALDLFKAAPDSDVKTSNLEKIYKNLAVALIEQGNVVEAVEIIEEGLPTYHSLNDMLEIARSHQISDLSRDANRALAEENFASAQEKFVAAITLAKELDNKALVLNSYCKLIEAQQKAHQNVNQTLTEALEYLQVNKDAIRDFAGDVNNILAHCGLSELSQARDIQNIVELYKEINGEDNATALFAALKGASLALYHTAPAMGVQSLVALQEYYQQPVKEDLDSIWGVHPQDPAKAEEVLAPDHVYVVGEFVLNA